jgi:PAS domain S-box-containing protein
MEYGGEQGVEVFMHDITIKKRSEERVSLLASIVESSDDAIIAADPEGAILYWNKGAEKLFGYSAGELNGKTINILLPDGKKDDWIEIFGIIMNGGSISQYKTFMKKKDGGVIDVSMIISPIKFKDQTVGASSIFRISDNTNAGESSLKS